MTTQNYTKKAQEIKATNEANHKMGLIGKTTLVLFVVVPHLAVVLAIIQLWNKWVVWQDVLVLLVFYVLTIWGVAIGFHRMLTHRSFETYEPIRFVFLALGSMALQGSAVAWAATHLKHHKYSDKKGDPHSPLEGFVHAHLGWLFGNNFERSGKWVKPYEKDKTAQFVDKTFPLWTVLSFVLPGAMVYALGGSFWQGVLWGGLVRLFFVNHMTWSVNSVCHTFGKKEFASPDRSRNEWIVGWFGFGEGWHNNHHAFPSAAYHGMHWWQIDINAYLIRFMKWIGLVYNVKMPTREQVEARRL